MIAGTLDSYPVVVSGDCELATSTPSCGSSTSSPCVTVSANAGDQNLIGLFIIGILFLGVLRFIFSKPKQPKITSI